MQNNLLRSLLKKQLIYAKQLIIISFKKKRLIQNNLFMQNNLLRSLFYLKLILACNFISSSILSNDLKLCDNFQLPLYMFYIFYKFFDSFKWLSACLVKRWQHQKHVSAPSNVNQRCLDLKSAFAAIALLAQKRASS